MAGESCATVEQPEGRSRTLRPNLSFWFWLPPKQPYEFIQNDLSQLLPVIPQFVPLYFLG
jgi:hypothetical protein